MLKTLLKKQLYELNYTFFYDQKKGKMRSKGSSITLIALYVLLMVGVVGGMFAIFAAMACPPLVEAGMGWLYFITVMKLLFLSLRLIFATTQPRRQERTKTNAETDMSSSKPPISADNA